MSIVVPPPDWATIFKNPERLDVLFKKGSTSEFQKVVLQANDQYIPWEKFRYRPIPEGISHEEVWAYMKIGRKGQNKFAPFEDKKTHPFVYGITDSILKGLHEIDLWSGGNITTDKPGPLPPKEQYIVSSLMEEAIASSQLEGAATTRKVAKEMLRLGRKPKDKNEKMVLNNWETIQYIRENKYLEITPALLLEIHSLITKGTLVNPKEEGSFRKRDDIVVEYNNETVHVPPPFANLTQRVEAFCNFFNKDDQNEKWIHPIIKGIMLHFWLAYDHPFADGNGRTARALMYWYLLSRNYTLFEYLSISRYLVRAPGQYVRAYLYTETDENDLTYFIKYNLEAVKKAINDLKVYLERKQKEISESSSLLKKCRGLNLRQKGLIYHAIGHPDSFYTIQEHRNHHGIAYDTARNDLLGLVGKKLLTKIREGHEYVFKPSKRINERLRSDNQKVG